MGGDTPAVAPKPWPHQEALLDTYFTVDSQDFLAAITPGGGKTIAGMLVAVQLAQRQGLVIVAPTAEVKRQWIKQAAAFGISMCDGERPESHLIVTTYQQVAMKAEWFREMVTERRTLVIFDEVHHMSEKKSWGERCLLAFGEAWRRLSLTGTAFRSDSSRIPFLSYSDKGFCQPDFVFGYKDAVTAPRQIVRVVEFSVREGRMKWLRDGRKYSSRFSDNIAKKDRSSALATALDANGDLVRDMLLEAQSKLLEYPQDGGLVIAKDVPHAKAIADKLETLTGEKPVVVHSYERKKSAEAIKLFRSGTGRWLVSVQMVSEGVDIPRLRVLVYATNYSTELFFRQAIGRIVRGSGLAFCWIPAHPPFVDLVEGFQEEPIHTLGPLGNDGGGGAGSGGLRPASTFYPLESETIGSRIVRSFVHQAEQDLEIPSPAVERERQKTLEYHAKWQKERRQRMSPEELAEHWENRRKKDQERWERMTVEEQEASIERDRARGREKCRAIYRDPEKRAKALAYARQWDVKNKEKNRARAQRYNAQLSQEKKAELAEKRRRSALSVKLNPPFIKFAERLAEILQARGMSKAELSHHASIGTPTITDYSKGRKYPTPSKIARICKALDVTEEVFASPPGSEIPQSHNPLKVCIRGARLMEIRLSRELSQSALASLIGRIDQPEASAPRSRLRILRQGDIGALERAAKSMVYKSLADALSLALSVSTEHLCDKVGSHVPEAPSIKVPVRKLPRSFSLAFDRERAREIFVKRGLSIYALSKLSKGSSITSFGRVLNGNQKPSDQLLNHLAHALRVPVSCLGEPVGSPIPPAEDYREETSQ